MKPNDSEREIIKGMIKEGIILPDNTSITDEVMKRLRQEALQAENRRAGFFNPPAVLMTAFLVVLAMVPFIHWFFGVLSEQMATSHFSAFQEFMSQINGYLIYSPLFLLIFLVLFMLYKLDRFLEKRSAMQ